MTASRIVYWMKTWNSGNSSGLLAAVGGSAIFLWVADFAACGCKVCNSHKILANCRRQWGIKQRGDL